MTEEKNISRRQWLERMAVPVLATAGATIIAGRATAAPSSPPDDKLSGAGVYNIRDYGATGDGKTLNTVSIQKAIDDCFGNKGGTVLIPAGEFLSGTLQLKSNVTLHIAAAGKLLGSPERKDYTAGVGVPESNGNIVFLYAVNAENISIEGKGTIDGNGLAFFNGKGDNTGPGQHGVGGNFDRPHLAVFYQCTHLRLNDVFLTASAYHCLRILYCKQVYADGIGIYNRVNKNNDGFHFNDCEHVHLVNCDVQCQDDACALFGTNKFVTITSCSFSTRWSVFRFGGGDSQNITVSNCLIYDTYGCPVKISAGSANIENLSFSNIIMQNVTGPVGIGFSGPPNKNPGNNSDTLPVAKKSFIRNIVFNNIRATVVAQPLDHPDIHFGVSVREGEKNSCITLNAMNEHYLENISFTDVHIKYAGGGTIAQAAKYDPPKIAAEYFGVWDPAPGGPPAYGMYARNVKGLTLQNVRFEYDQPDARPALILDNVQDACINGLTAMGSATSELIRCINTKDILLTATKILSPAASLLRIVGTVSEGITVDGGDISKAAKAVIFENGAGKKSVKLRV